MDDNGTVIQLKKALNQLLDAYESLKLESEKVKKENTKLKDDVQSLEVMNTGLNTKLSALNDTTDHHSTEMGEMLGRIEDILGPSDDDSSVDDVLTEDVSAEDENSVDNTEEKEEDSLSNIHFSNNNNNSKDIDLGRMQSLLNGFNN